jgi:hypothetical protein
LQDLSRQTEQASSWLWSSSLAGMNGGEVVAWSAAMARREGSGRER